MTEISRRAGLAGAAASALMRFVKTAPASAAAPFAEKQNANFQSYNVGTHQLTAACEGVATINLSDNYAPGTSKEDIGKVFAEHHLPADRVTRTFNPIIVNTGPKLVVIDTGLGPDQFAQTKGKVRQFHGNLAAANIDRAAVHTVIISHFHGGHWPPQSGALLQTRRQIHSIIRAITSPNNKSAAAHTNAEMKLAA